MPATARSRPTQPSGLGSAPDSSASGRTVKIGLSAKTGPTIEMSPRALARASRLAIPNTSTAEAGMAGHTAPGGVNGSRVKTK